MNRNELCNHLLESIKKHANVELKNSQYDQNLTELGIDSIKSLDIANDMEDLLDIIIDDKDIIHFRSMNKILDYFDQKHTN